jgi:hypothetical protein
MALADRDLSTASCTNVEQYAKIIEILDAANWYDDLAAISIDGGNFGLTSATSPRTLVVRGVKANGDAPFVIANSLLSFTSATGAVATAGLHTGIITYIGNGTSLITVVVDAANTFEAQCTVTCS